jgi:hypothetical protein
MESIKYEKGDLAFLNENATKSWPEYKAKFPGPGVVRVVFPTKYSQDYAVKMDDYNPNKDYSTHLMDDEVFAFLKRESKKL